MAGTLEAEHLQDVLEKTFEVGGEGRLFLSLPRAEVRLLRGTGEQIHLSVRAAGSTLTEAQTVVEQVDLKTRFQGGVVKIETSPLDPFFMSTWSRLPSPPLQITLHLPPTCHIDASTFAGRLFAENLAGRIILSASGGTIEAHDLEGRVEVYANASDAALSRLRGGQFTLHTRGGHIEVQHVDTDKASLRLCSASGTIEEVDSPLELFLSDAEVTLEGLQNELYAESYASQLALHLADGVKNVRLKAAGGALDLHLPSSLSANVALEASPVVFDAPPSFRGEQSSDHVEGALNGGRVPITARAVCGTVSCHVG